MDKLVVSPHTDQCYIVSLLTSRNLSLRFKLKQRIACSLTSHGSTLTEFLSEVVLTNEKLAALSQASSAVIGRDLKVIEPYPEI